MTDKDERIIESCPMSGCGGTCSVEKVSPPQDDSVYYYVVRCDNLCGYVCRLLDSEAEAIAAHNAVSKKVSGYDEVVRLLRESSRFTYIKDNGSIVLSPSNDDGRKEWIENRDDLLARIDKEGGK